MRLDAIRLAARIGKRLGGYLRRFARRSDGGAAIEFALVAPPFLALLAAILETALVFFYQEVLQTATSEAGRLIMTGQAQTQNLSAAAFQQDVCTDAGALFNCANLHVNVQTFTSFSGVSLLNPIQNGVLNGGSLNYQPSGPGDIVLVQVFYELPVSPAPFGFDLSNMNGGSRLIEATAVFRNEPYQ